MITKASDLFLYLRGALRGAYGQENLRDKSILLTTLPRLGQEVLLHLCIDGVNLFFQDHHLSSYHQAHTICGQVSPYAGEPVDIIINFEKRLLIVKGKSHDWSKVGPAPYVQGVHDFYL